MSMFLNYIEKLVYVLISFSFKLIVNLLLSKKQRRLLLAFIARIFLLLISPSVSRGVPKGLHFFHWWINFHWKINFHSFSVLFLFTFSPFLSRFSSIFADVVVVTGKIARIIRILHFNIEMLDLHWLCITMFVELIWCFMTSDRLMMIVMVINDCVWSL